jgi:O-antigen ligase
MRLHRSQVILAPLYIFALGAPLSQAVGSLSAGLLVLLALVRLLREGWPPRGAIPRSIVLWLGFYFLFHFLATLLASPFDQNWAKLAGEMWLKLLLVAVPLLARGHETHVVRALKLMLVVGAGVAVYSIWQHFTGIDLWRGGSTPRAPSGHMGVGFFGHHLTYGGHVLLLFLCAASWALLGVKRDSGLLRRLLPWLICAVLGLALVWSFARSALLGALFACPVLVQALPGRRRWAAFAGLAAVGAAALATPAITQRFAALFAAGAEETRINLWRSSLHGIADRPWLGFGAGNFEELMRLYEVPGFYDSQAHSHNDFLMHAVNAGLLGLLAALGLLFSTVYWLWRLRRGLAERAWIPVAAVACQVGISVAGLFQVYQTDNEVEMILYFVLGAAFALAWPGPRENTGLASS